METVRENRRVGWPLCGVSAAEVTERRRDGHSWRRIAHDLGIGTATAMRLSKARETRTGASQNSGAPSQNSQGETT